MSPHLCRFHASANGAVARGATGSASSPIASTMEDTSGFVLESHTNPTKMQSMSQSPKPRQRVLEAMRYRRRAAKNANAVPSKEPIPMAHGALLHKAKTMPDGIRLYASSMPSTIKIGPTEQTTNHIPHSNHGRPINVIEAPRPTRP
ncbi:MAG: hypothetical protein CEE38_11980 [Planctomycetes bacterium B3_Pla]|nr:MAG: hypothetical protein CEE38_11980 [Planctomycetes bacterium B3_Pla]